MKRHSILLAVDGSAQSRQASELCWNLAKTFGARVSAQHVVDTHSAWQFLGHESPGFLDRQEYMGSYHHLCSSLFSLGEALSNAFAKASAEHGVDSAFYLDEGEPLKELCKRAQDHDLVVIGHRQSKEQQDQDQRRQFMRLSVAESLAHDCPRPLLVVQSACPSWQFMTIMVSAEHINEKYINHCLDLAQGMNLEAGLLCLKGGPHEENAASLIKDLREANPRLGSIPIASTTADQSDNFSKALNWEPSPSLNEADRSSGNLVVIPTREVAGQRLTVFGSSPSSFVRYLSLPTILLWPEEYHVTLADLPETASAKSS